MKGWGFSQYGNFLIIALAVGVGCYLGDDSAKHESLQRELDSARQSLEAVQTGNRRFTASAASRIPPPGVGLTRPAAGARNLTPEESNVRLRQAGITEGHNTSKAGLEMKKNSFNMLAGAKSIDAKIDAVAGLSRFSLAWEHLPASQR